MELHLSVWMGRVEEESNGLNGIGDEGNGPGEGKGRSEGKEETRREGERKKDGEEGRWGEKMTECSMHVLIYIL